MSDRDLARALFEPRAVALVGASGDAAKNTARPLRYLKAHGFKGRVLPINPGRAEVLGEPAWPDLRAAAEAAADAGGAIDHAYIMVPADAVPAVIADCARAHVPLVTIYSDGFAEVGDEGFQFQEEMVETARAGGIRIVGPNSMGVVNVRAGLAMTTNAALEAPKLIPGPLAVVSQSGTALGALLSRGQARGFGFSKLVSIGNEADLSVGEIIDMLIDDADTGAILLFLETIRHRDAFAAAARRAFQAGKPVIAYKLGRSDAGRQMAVSHSGALAGRARAADAFFRAHGIIRVDILEALLEIPFLVKGRKPATGRRVSVVTTTGGGAAMVVDRLGLAGVDFAPPPPPPVINRMITLDLRIGEGPVIDLTMAGARPDVYGPVLKDLIASDGCDVVVPVVGSSAQFRPEVAVSPIIAEAKAGAKPVAVFCVPEATESLKALADAGIAGFRTPESCADAVRAYLDWRAPAAQPSPRVATKAAVETVARLLDKAPARSLDVMASLAAFLALGIASVPTRVVREGGAMTGVEFPAAAKVLSADVPHKTEAGGVVLGIQDSAALRRAIAQIRERVRAAQPKAKIAGVLVQKMEKGVAEALVGYCVDPEAGPLVILGAGGTLTELYDDAAVRPAPVDRDTALAMIGEVKGLAPVLGYRNLPKGDAAALAAAVEAMASLAYIKGVAEAEINPLIV
ncbi:MAG: acetate--CoA ligase family protein, partial [Rhodospirillales bacterium]